MKPFILSIVLLFCGASCQDDDPVSNFGCLTGIFQHDANRKRVRIKCCTKDEYLNGPNLTATYDDIKWTPIGNCDDCK